MGDVLGALADIGKGNGELETHFDFCDFVLAEPEFFKATEGFEVLNLLG